MIAWDPSMSTGVAEIDAQHQELLRRMAEFLQALEAGQGREETGKILDFIQFYAKWHFKREEKCMAEHQCAIAEVNHTAHGEFIRRFDILWQQYQVSDIDPRIPYETSQELANWFVQHILRIDTRLNACVNKTD